jgi:hypothetical protein
LQIDQTGAILALRLPSAHANTHVAAAKLVIVLWRRRNIVIEAACGTAAEHGGTCLVDALVELGCANIALLIVIVRGTCHDLGVW